MTEETSKWNITGGGGGGGKEGEVVLPVVCSWIAPHFRVHIQNYWKGI